MMFNIKSDATQRTKFPFLTIRQDRGYRPICWRKWIGYSSVKGQEICLRSTPSAAFSSSAHWSRIFGSYILLGREQAYSRVTPTSFTASTRRHITFQWYDDQRQNPRPAPKPHRGTTTPDGHWTARSPGNNSQTAGLEATIIKEAINTHLHPAG